MDFIRPIGPVDRDVEALHRVERARGGDDREEKQPESRRKRARPSPQPPPRSPQPEGPDEGDDGHMHIDVRA